MSRCRAVCVEFRVHAVSRVAQIANPIVRIGFHLLRGRERHAFLDSTKQRMRTFTELALARRDPDHEIHTASATLTRRSARDGYAAHQALASRIQRR